MSFLSNLLTPGWSTSRPGDMKNPSSMGMRQLGALAEPTKTGPITAAVAAANQAKLHKEFTDMLAAKHAAAAKPAVKIDDGYIKGFSATAIAVDEIEAMNTETVASLLKLGIPKDEAERMTGHISTTAPQAKPNPDRPQTEVDAW